ncbi:MAG: hypothetical protein ACRDJN_19495, partial [Chloroflexota bacterium]
MRVLLGGAGVFWPWLGIGAWGLAAGVALGRAAGLGWPWPLISGAPLGVLLYSLALVPALALLPPTVAVPAAALPGVALLAVVVANLTPWPPSRLGKEERSGNDDGLHSPSLLGKGPGVR